MIERSEKINTFQRFFSHDPSLQLGFADDDRTKIDESLYTFCGAKSWVMIFQPGAAAYRGLEA
jgi:hypothetical protein